MEATGRDEWLNMSPLFTARQHCLHASAVIARGILSVCPSVTYRCFVQMNDDTIVCSALSDTKINLVSGEVKFIRIFTVGLPPAKVLK